MLKFLHEEEPESTKVLYRVNVKQFKIEWKFKDLQEGELKDYFERLVLTDVAKETLENYSE